MNIIDYTSDHHFMPTKQNTCSFNINNCRNDKNFLPHSINGRGRGELRSRCFQFHPLPLYLINNNFFYYVQIYIYIYIYEHLFKALVAHIIFLICHG